VADHVRKYYQCYPRIVGEPPIFWKFDTDILPAGHVVQQATSDSGDKCHHDVRGLDDATLWQVFETKDISDFSSNSPRSYSATVLLRVSTRAAIAASASLYPALLDQNLLPLADKILQFAQV
jgi:hypothetical protein